MAHTLRKVNFGNTALCYTTISDYVAGGEAYTLAELGLTTAVIDVFFIPDERTPLRPLLSGGKVFVVKSGSPLTTNNILTQEIPTTVGLNFSFSAIIVGT